MDIEKMDSFVKVDVDDDDDHVLPGFRFHPTDEELVGFYLRRKVDKRPIRLELIKHIDIYKYDPWDLPKGNTGEKEWYFFCRRGRKYRNSIRPNRVTASGFWKATGIDKPIYSDGRRDCIGLKKSLVYYRGNAGKGTKTEWMMHEFRLPPLDYQHNNSNKSDHKTHLPDELQEAEVWTICRIMKRETSQRKCMATMKEISEGCKRNNTTFGHATSKTCRVLESVQGYDINFTSTNQYKPEQFISNLTNHSYDLSNQLPITTISQPPSSVTISSLYSDFSSPEVGELGPYGEWDELRCIVEFAKDPFLC